MEKLTSDLDELKDNCLSLFSDFEDELEGKEFNTWADSHLPWLYWNELTDELRSKSRDLQKQTIELCSNAAKNGVYSPLISEADKSDIGYNAKKIRAALQLRKFYYSDPDVIHNEGEFLGFSPAKQSDREPAEVFEARNAFIEGYNDLKNIILLLDEDSSKNTSLGSLGRDIEPTKYRKNTAFIMMWMDEKNPDLDDVKDAVKDVFRDFGIKALRADDIEHEEVITKRIIDEIKSSEFLFADLSGARPNVYYEVGFAHALGRRVILYRKKGSGIHFDLTGYNCPEYENLRELKDKLTRRLEAVTGKSIEQGTGEEF